MALKSKRSTFTYKPRTADQVKTRATRQGGSFDSIYKPGIDSFSPKAGDHLFRYLPPAWDDADHYGFTIFVHYGIGPEGGMYLCLRKMLNKPCPCCEASKESKDAGEEDEANRLKPSERIVSWVLDRDGDDPEKPLVYNQSWTQDRDVTALCINERTGEILMIDHPDTGYDVSFKRVGTTMKNTKYYGWQIARESTPIADDQKVQDQILDYIAANPIPEILNFYDYNYIKGVLSGTVVSEDEDIGNDGNEGEETPVRGGPSKTPARPQKRGQQEEPEEVVEDEEAPPPPSRRPGRRPAPEPVEEPIDEEVDEEAEEAPPPPRAARRPARQVEEVVEDEEAPPPPRRVVRK